MDIVDLHRRAQADSRTISASEIRWLADEAMRCAAIEDAIKTSGWDTASCRKCGGPVLCLADLLPEDMLTCRKCRDNG